MWNPVRVLIAQLTEISELIAEQNSLLREQIQLISHKPAQKAVRPHSPSSRLAPPSLGPKRTAKDVWSMRELAVPTTEDQARVEEVTRRMEAQAAAQPPQ